MKKFTSFENENETSMMIFQKSIVNNYWTIITMHEVDTKRRTIETNFAKVTTCNKFSEASIQVDVGSTQIMFARIYGCVKT